MKATETTFKLVKSLTKNEKRYFRMFASITEGEKNYIRIFEEMDKQEVYDEQKIKAKFKDKKFVNHFTYEKNYLQQMILKALRNYRSDEELNYINAFADVEILIKKGLPEVAFPILEKYKIRTLESENLAEYFVFSRSEMRLAASSQNIQWFVDYISSGFAKDENLLEQWKYFLFIITKYNELNILKGKFKFVNNSELKKELREMISEPVWKGIFQKLGTKGKIAWYNFFTQYYLLVQDYQQAYLSASSLLEFIQQNNLSIIQIGLLNYLVMLINKIETASVLEKYDEVQAYCTHLKQVITSADYDEAPHIRNQFTATHFEATISNYTLWGKFAECIEFYNTHILQINALKNAMSSEAKISIQYYMALSYFYLGDFHASLEFLDQVLKQKKADHYAMQTMPAQTLYLMIHLDMGNQTFVANSLRNYLRSFSKQQIDIKSNSLLLKIFRQIIAFESNKKELIQCLKDGITEINKLKSEPNEFIFLRNVMADRWLKNKLMLLDKSL